MLSMGYSKPWQAAMEVMTGNTTMNANPILEYFRPLIKWLEKENRRLNLTVGWREGKQMRMGIEIECVLKCLNINIWIAEKTYCIRSPATTSSNCHKIQPDKLWTFAGLGLWIALLI